MQTEINNVVVAQYWKVLVSVSLLLWHHQHSVALQGAELLNESPYSSITATVTLL